MPFRTIALASLGGAIEFYDFVIYGILAAYIAPTFFPAHNGTVSLASTFAAFAVGYLVRPLGGVAFSHFGDRFGRRTTFLASLVGISVATIGMAVSPSYATWGVGGSVCFVLLRLTQGFCFGGELPGAVTYLVEVAPPGRRGIVCGLLFCCVTFGVVVASAVSVALHAMLPEQAILDYGWRLAFGFGGILGLLSYLPRRQLQESPVFTRMRERLELERVPFVTVLRSDLREIMAGILVTAALAARNSILFAYLPVYLVHVAGYPSDSVEIAVTTGLIIGCVAVLAAGALADWWPLFAAHRFGLVALLLGSCPLFWLVSTHNRLGLAVLVSVFNIVGASTAVTFSLVLADLFPARVRFSGVSSSFNISIALFGGLAPLAATTLTAISGDPVAPGYLLAAVCLVSLAASVWAERLVLRRNQAKPCA